MGKMFGNSISRLLLITTQRRNVYSSYYYGYVHTKSHMLSYTEQNTVLIIQYIHSQTTSYYAAI